MHADTLAALNARILAETAGSVYANKTPAEIAEMLNAPVEITAAPVYQDVLISDVEGYLAARLLLVGLQDWVATAQAGQAKQAARQLLQIIEGGRLRVFLTSDPTRRATVLGMFQGLCASGAGGLTMDHYADIAAMTVAPAGSPTYGSAKWVEIIDGISGVGNEPGPPNAASAELIEGAINGGG